MKNWYFIVIFAFIFIITILLLVYWPLVFFSYYFCLCPFLIWGREIAIYLSYILKISIQMRSRVIENDDKRNHKYSLWSRENTAISQMWWLWLMRMDSIWSPHLIDALKEELTSRTHASRARQRASWDPSSTWQACHVTSLASTPPLAAPWNTVLVWETNAGDLH